MERRERVYYDEKRRKGRADYNSHVDVYGNYHSNRYAGYDGITSDGREIKIPAFFLLPTLCYECFKASCKTC